jgi:hypothetical protein
MESVDETYENLWAAELRCPDCAIASAVLFAGEDVHLEG